MEWKVKEGEPFPVGLGPASPMERLRVPLYIRQGGQAMDRGLYRWELNRGQSFLTAVKGLASEERENTPEILVSSETLSLTEQEFFEWIQGKKRLEELEAEGGVPYWCYYIEENLLA